ncbi:MAG: type II toxin-antitoxin system ParD family antitoxin [Pyrinomonadaceae bacterium]|nr:type II toxin-antitoxin system ParD family antitoxin [Phycisphaerales bacterium]
MARKTVTISLPAELQAFLDSRVSSGRYGSASEVVREGLRMLQERERKRVSSIDELRREIDLGLEQANRGQVIDGEQFLKGLESKLNRRGSKRRKAG